MDRGSAPYPDHSLWWSFLACVDSTVDRSPSLKIALRSKYLLFSPRQLRPRRDLGRDLVPSAPQVTLATVVTRLPAVIAFRSLFSPFERLFGVFPILLTPI